MKNKKMILSTFCCLSIVLCNSMPTVVLASEYHQNNSESTQLERENMSENNLTQDVIDKADQFVQVQNNQYVLTEGAKKEFNNSEITQIKKIISESNAEVKHENALIDTSDKAFYPYTNNSNPFVSFASTGKKYTYRNFWWGTRFYFRSNAAVDRMVQELRDSQSTLSAFALGAGGAATVAGPYAAIPGMLLGFAAWKYNEMASGLQSYNEAHKKNQIYMDVNMTGNVSYHILK